MARPEITFITGQYVPRCHHRVDKVFSDYQTLQYMEGGQVSLRVDDRDYALNGRWFWSAYPGPRIAFHAADAKGWVHRYVAFRGPLVARWAEEGLFPIVAPQRPQGERSYARAFDDVLTLSQAAGRWAAIRAAHRLEAILIDLAEARDAAPPPPRWVMNATEELARDVTSPADYESLSQKLGMSVRSLRRNFRARLGTSPHQYRIVGRVQRARELLLKTDVPLKEIAQELGYSDVFYFGRQFKQHTGVSPATFRRSREG
jgi:AraC-like DNA-binding protein